VQESDHSSAIAAVDGVAVLEGALAAQAPALVPVDATLTTALQVALRATTATARLRLRLKPQCRLENEI
jgi:hypothetical protein